MTGYTYDMSTYLRKGRQNETQLMTETYKTVKNLTQRVEGVHQLYMSNFFPSLDLMTSAQELSKVVELSERIIKECQGDPDNTTLKSKMSEIHARVTGVLTTTIWKGEMYAY
jgi:hypothetical protein